MFERQKYIHIESLDTDVTVIVTKADKKAHNIPDDCAGYVCEVDGLFTLALPIRWDEATVWHEAHHLARWLNHYHGIETNAEEHEADAYLQEYIVKLLKTNVYNRKA